MDRKHPMDRKHLLPWQRAVIDAFVRRGEAVRVEPDVGSLFPDLPRFAAFATPGFDRSILARYPFGYADDRGSLLGASLAPSAPYVSVTPARAPAPPEPEHHVLVGGDDRGRHYVDALTRGIDIHEEFARVLFDCETPFRDIELRVLNELRWRQPPPHIERPLFTAALRGWSL